MFATLSLVVAVSATALSAAPPSSPPGDSAPAPVVPVPERSAAPTEWVTVVDDTATITVVAPARWVDVDISPTSTVAREEAADDIEVPLITVADDLQEFYNSWDLPGVILSALPHADDLDATIDERNTGGCATEEREPFARDDLGGVIVRLGECGPNGAGFVFVAANSPAHPEHTLLLELGGAGAAGDHVSDTMIATFGFAADGATPSHYDIDDGPVERQPASPTAYPVAADAVRLTDDSGRLSIAVPPSWTDVGTAAGDDSSRPVVQAGTDLEALAAGAADGSFGAPGVYATAGPMGSDLGAIIGDIPVAESCAVAPVTLFNNGTFEGYIRRFERCGGHPDRRGVIVAASAPDDSFQVAAMMLLGGDDASTLDTLLGSLTFDAEAVAAAPIVDGG